MEVWDQEKIPAQSRADPRRPERRRNHRHKPAQREFPRQSHRLAVHLRARRRQDRFTGNPPMSDGLELDGRRALVTGGTQGIGAAVVARLRETGAKVLTTARTTPARFPDADLFVPAEVATAEGCSIVAEAVFHPPGGVHIIVPVLCG